VNTCLTFVTRAFAPLRLFALQHSLEAHSSSRQAVDCRETHSRPRFTRSSTVFPACAVARHTPSIFLSP